MVDKEDIKDMVVWLHDQARATKNTYFRAIADTLNDLAKLVTRPKE